jgi:hypothetical protein
MPYGQVLDKTTPAFLYQRRKFRIVESFCWVVEAGTVMHNRRNELEHRKARWIGKAEI